jgi:hypothetical protein
MMYVHTITIISNHNNTQLKEWLHQIASKRRHLYASESVTHATNKTSKTFVVCAEHNAKTHRYGK